MRDLSVVIPVYNNQESLPSLTKKLIESVPKRLKEIVFVNDGSKDTSLDVLIKLSGQYDFVRVINQRNFGQQKAIQNGLKETTGTLIAVMDADLQDNPIHLVTMVVFYEEHGCTCFIRRKGVYQGIGKMLTSMMLKTIIWITSSLHQRAGSYYLIDRPTLNKALDISENCNNTYMSIIVAHVSKKIGYMDAKRGKSQKSGYNFKKRLTAGITAIKCSFECLWIKCNIR